MGSLAQLAAALGYRVVGVDKAIYPPMSTQLQRAGIEVDEGYENHRLLIGGEAESFDHIVVGNAISRGNPALEYILDNGLAFVSGPQWIAEHVLATPHVLAIAGTHGKTTTSSMVAWILESAGLSPGFLIGGVPENFGCSARLGSGKFFVIEADEYDSAFSDKRSKFVHYRPDTLVINNVEFDHADIFSDLAAIQTQFHQMIRTLPRSAQIIVDDADAIREILRKGCWSETTFLRGESSPWSIVECADDFSQFRIVYDELQSAVQASSEPAPLRQRAKEGSVEQGLVSWALSGEHNVYNALSAVAAARSVGVSVADACAALANFKNVKRRMQLIAEKDDIKVFDDFAHHPTAIRLTLEGAKKRFRDQRIVAIVEAGSNTMRTAVHQDVLPAALAQADYVFWFSEPQSAQYNPRLDTETAEFYSNIDELVDAVDREALSGDILVVMSNSGFQGFHQRLASRILSR